MKQGYIVWNQTCYGEGFEFFGVYRTREQAEKCFRRIMKQRFGKRNITEDELSELEMENGGEDSYQITYFEEAK